ncbi:MAG: carbohydrate-binding protein [Mobilitalea sp.]
MELSIKITDVLGKVLAEQTKPDLVTLVYEKEYQEGDSILIESSEDNVYLKVQIDDALGDAFVYLTQKEIKYQIPFKEKRSSYSPKVFYGTKHWLWVRKATEEEISAYKNLALNVMDQHTAEGCYPHAAANVETRDEAVFAARNAIDGVFENHSHGEWPYQSWGINQQDDATMKLDFGRSVIIDKIVLYTRSDFPHDNWWKKVNITFSDQSMISWDLEKSEKAHVLSFGKREVSWLELHDLVKSEDPSPFPALSQIEVYGMEAN